MHRSALVLSSALLLGATICNAQSLADAARENRKQKTGATAAKMVTSDDFSAPADVVIHLIPGTTSSGQGTVIAPGRGKHSYAVTTLDCSRFNTGGVLHITITAGGGLSEVSLDLYPEGPSLPSQGFPNSMASAHNIRSGAGAKIDYRFDHGTTFRLAAEGSWNSKPGDTNTYNFVVEVENR
ncbi:MAG TPA: hypothetical protein VKV39_01965 [Candidatus Sulfotelmatobacter sp.]|nr:hypothetical protein [Candidatus Sulfotelmatobacter sp.]